MVTCFHFLSSLERIALVKIAVILWNCLDIRKYILEFEVPVNHELKYDSEWQRIANIVLEKGEQLHLPQILKAKLSRLICPIGLEIIRWRNDHARNLKFYSLPLEFRWTQLGRIDERETAFALVEDETLDCFIRYRFACTYCLEQYIPGLWKGLEGCVGAKLSVLKHQESFMVLYWSYYLCNEVFPEDVLPVKDITRPFDLNLYTKLFLCCIWYENEVASKYFLEKVNHDEQHEVLVEAVQYNLDPDTLICTSVTYIGFPNLMNFLLSCMNEEQLTEVFSKMSVSDILDCVLIWPITDFIVSLVEKLKMFFSPDNYIKILITSFRVRRTYFDSFEKCYELICQQIPINHRLYIIGGLLPFLACDDDKYGFKMVLETLTAKDKNNIVLGCIGESICKELIFRNNWTLLQYFISECVTSENSVAVIRTECEKYFKIYSYIEQLKETLQPKVLTLLDDISSKIDGK